MSGRRRDPDRVVDTFLAELQRYRTNAANILAALGNGSALELQRQVSVDAFARSAVAFEQFRSDWHLAAITQDAESFRRTQRHLLECALNETGRSNLIPFLPAALMINKRPTLDDVADILDASRRNLSIPSLEKWGELAVKHLEDPWKAKVNALAADNDVRKLVAAVIALRNTDAHQSTQARGFLTSALAALNRTATYRDLARGVQPRRGGSSTGNRAWTVNDIGVYLHAVQNGTRRSDRYIDALGGLANRLRR